MKRELISKEHANFIYRTRVPWGWLVESVDDVRSPVNSGYDQPDYKEGYEWRTSICFVFDPLHLWKIDSKKP